MRVLIVEDDKELAVSLQDQLVVKGYVVDVAGNGADGLALVEINEYDIVVLDLNLPEMDGLEVLRRMRALKPSLSVLVLTARGSVTDRITGLDQGCDDYLVKPFHFEELCARIRALLRRDRRVRDPVLRCGDLMLDPAARTAWLGRRKLELTRKELATLEYLMRHPGQVITQEELLEHVWGDEVDSLTGTVRVHIASVRNKLGDNGRDPRYIGTAIGRGYFLRQHRSHEGRDQC